MNFKRSGPLYVPDREPVRRYTREDQREYERRHDSHWWHRPRLAFSVIDFTAIAAGTGSSATTAGIDTTGANLIVIASAAVGTAVITDSKSNVYTALTTRVGSFGIEAQLHYCFNPTVGTGHTFTNTLASGQPSIAALTLSGSAASPFDQENGNAGNTSTTSQQVGSVTPTTDDQILVTCFVHFTNNAASIDSGFSTPLQVNGSSGTSLGLAMSYKIQTTAGAENPAWTWNPSGSQYPMAIATFKSGAAAAGNPWYAYAQQ